MRNKMGWNQQFTTKKLLGNADSVAYEYATSFANGGTASSVSFNLSNLNQVVQIGTKQTNFVAPSVQQAKDWEDYADLFMYMDEMIERFITGKEPLSGWDAYVAKCEELGLSQALAIKQEQYDAYTKIMSNLK